MGNFKFLLIDKYIQKNMSDTLARSETPIVLGQSLEKSVRVTNDQIPNIRAAGH